MNLEKKTGHKDPPTKKMTGVGRIDVKKKLNQRFAIPHLILLLKRVWLS